MNASTANWICIAISLDKTYILDGYMMLDTNDGDFDTRWNTLECQCSSEMSLSQGAHLNLNGLHLWNKSSNDGIIAHTH